MSNIARIVFAGKAIVVIGAVGIVYGRVGLPMLDRLEDTDGPMGEWILKTETLVPLLLGLLLLTAFIILLVGPIQQERGRNQQPRRRRGR
jgi:uncharacterized membrane protein